MGLTPGLPEGSGSALQLYLRTIRRVRALSPEEELATARAAWQGDAHARQAVVRQHVGLFIGIAEHDAGYGLPMSDLVEEGNLGLLQAVAKCEPGRGFRLAAYAAWWIHQAAARALVQRARLVRLPVQALRELDQVLRVRCELEAEGAGDSAAGVRAPVIAKRLGWFVPVVESLLGLTRWPESLDVRLQPDELWRLGQGWAEGRAVDPVHARLGQEVVQLLATGLLALSGREREVLSGRYGLHDREPETLELLAVRLHLTRERVRQIQQEALAKLRRRMLLQGVDREAVL